MIALPGIAIQNKIYESSNSLVYRGIRDDGVLIVVKMLKVDYPSSQELTRYRQEYTITRSLNLEGVVKAYSQQDYQRTLVIILEDFRGESLEQWMHKRPDIFCPMPLSTFLGLMIAVCDILGRIHAANIIHKDINPGNIVLNLDTGVVKIIDFGIATEFNRTNPTFKSPYVLEGTLAYLSPEQTGRMNRLLDYRTDFYSLGATFYELLTGHLPFPTTDILELVHCHIAKEPVPPHEINTAIPKPVSDIILKLMAKNAEERYQSAWGIKADLEICAEQLAEIGQISSIKLALQDISGQFQIPQKLYGRDKEVAMLLAAFERVACPESNRVAALPNNLETTSQREQAGNPKFQVEMMLVSGYAGIGKSALVQEIYKPITEKRGYFISGKFDQFQRNIPYSAIADALQKLVQQLLSEPDEQVQQWRSLLLTALGNNGQIIIDVIPKVELIIGKQPPVPEVGATEAQNRFHRIFGQFVRVFCSESHPLAIFLDDLQWIDSATLKLIELMLLDEQIQSLFLIGAYRNNEVNSTHPLVLMQEKLRKKGVVFQEIILTPLTLLPLNQLIAETLHHNTDTVRSLTQLVLRKTEGNPFFVNEFLRTLYSENLLTFDPFTKGEQKGVGGWQWNIAQIQAQNITDNVVELMLHKLKKLPENTQQILRLAACIGAEFNLNTLAIVCEKSPKMVFQDLLLVVQGGFIQPLSELDEDLLVQEYKFLHDRVQQAAYALIPEHRKQVTHYSIGQLLLGKLSEVEQSEMLFDIVNHINFGQSLLTHKDEKEKIARLNLAAAQKAISSTGYEAAIRYLETGIGLLEAEAWISQYDLMFNLYRTLCAAQLSNASYEQLSATTKVALEHIFSAVDRADIRVFQITQYTLQGECEEAVQTGLIGLHELGIEIKGKNLTELVREEFAAVAKSLENRSIYSLLTLPTVSDPVIQAMIKLIVVDISAYITANIELYCFISLRVVRLCIEHGNIAESIKAYANYGLLLSLMKGQYQQGYEFADLAVQLSYKLNSKSQQCKAEMLFGGFIQVWSKPIAGAAVINYKGFLASMESGNVQFAAYNLVGNIFNRLFQSENLTTVAEDNEKYQLVAEQIQDELSKVALAGAKFFIAKLALGQAAQEHDRLLRETEKIVHQGETSQIRFSICLYYILRMHLSCLTADFEQGYHYFVEAGKILNSIVGFTTYSSYFYYGSLILLNLYSGLSQAEQNNALEQIRSNQERLKAWSDSCPENFLHKFHLVEAEKARVLGQFFEAENLYEQAIQGAKDNEYLQEEALAYELAAKHYLVRGREKFAQTYMKEANYCYERWGAMAKVKNLETHYPQLCPKPSNVVSTPVRTTTGTISSASHTAFDLATVMKVAQAISSEIELEQLLSSLMQILIENAGAQTGCLLLENLGEWTIEAAYELNETAKVYAAQVLRSTPIANHLPQSIIQYVVRTHESVILNDATREGNFINEPYIQHNQTRSLLCLPLLNQSKLVGVLYLENQLATGVFTPERLQVLNLLSAQAAIAIENAKLYSKLRASESQMNQFLEAIPVGIGIIDGTGRPYYVNQRGIELMGKGIDPAATPEQLSEIYQFYVTGTDQIYPSEKLPIIRALSGERTRTDDIDIRQNNVTIPSEAWGTPVFDEQGNVVYAIAAFQDITERKQTEHLLANYNRTLEQQVAQRTAALQQSEAELRHREQELRLIANALPVLIGYVDANRCYQFINHTYQVWFNRSCDEILGNPVRQLLGEAVYQRVEPYINQVFAGQTVTLETEIPFPLGKRCLNVTLIPDFDHNAQVRGFYSLMTDISEQQAALRERKQAEEVLRHSEAQFREQAILSDFRADVDSALAQSASLPLILHRCAQAVVKHFNAAFARIWTLNKDNNVLELQASAGMYTRLDGEYSRVPVGSLKVGRIAQERCPLLTNNVFDESSIDKEWAKREGMVAFAGYPILLDEQLVGVIGMFTRHPIPSSNFEALEFSAREIALGIRRKQAEEALQASEAELRALFCAMPDPLLVVNAEGRILRASLIESEKLSNPIDEQVGRTFSEIFERSQADTFLVCIRQALSTQQPLTVEYSLIVGGWKTWFATRISPISEHSVIWLTRDITDRKRAEEASILEERNHMAREIHDTLAQAFTGIIIHARSASNKVTADPEKAQALLTQILDLARSGLAEARRSVEALHRPYLLESSNLQDALSRLAAELNSSITTQIVYEVMGTPYPLSSDLENNLFRIGQEALTNAIKHAEARKIHIELIYEPTQCSLRIKDDGQGFNVENQAMQNGFGLLGMAERAERIRAELKIQSDLEQGTEIAVFINRGLSQHESA
ncbi:AAA family ATPase [Nostoc sp. UCD121]|uniref:AAA family ATPase n=1 Tax=unclassified Nostoc TaxID=2593658 RepID=UPI001628C324|nr:MULTISPECIES: AAA family ATPase [unclassified Nostoc]MBC1221195.1 AAA family ATPase [Nostoc sp. UCD120]MBC1276837.1 AAA family ATPase [Nostoc sp. UCD121]MBC1295010.1 AAA family ATPase [Nostoc sp. UCD122]